MLLRYGRVYPNKSCWTRAHRLWLADERWPYPAQEFAWCDHLAAVDGLVARRAAIDEQLSLLMHADYLWPTVARLRCFRGLDSLTALALHVEVGDWARCARPARRLLVESAWHYARATPRGHPGQASGGPAGAHPADRLAGAVSAASSLATPARRRQARQRGDGRRRP